MMKSDKLQHCIYPMQFDNTLSRREVPFISDDVQMRDFFVAKLNESLLFHEKVVLSEPITVNSKEFYEGVAGNIKAYASHMIPIVSDQAESWVKFRETKISNTSYVKEDIPDDWYSSLDKYIPIKSPGVEKYNGTKVGQNYTDRTVGIIESRARMEQFGLDADFLNKHGGALRAFCNQAQHQNPQNFLTRSDLYQLASIPVGNNIVMDEEFTSTYELHGKGKDAIIALRADFGVNSEHRDAIQSLADAAYITNIPAMLQIPVSCLAKQRDKVHLINNLAIPQDRTGDYEHEAKKLKGLNRISTAIFRINNLKDLSVKDIESLRKKGGVWYLKSSYYERIQALQQEIRSSSEVRQVKVESLLELYLLYFKEIERHMALKRVGLGLTSEYVQFQYNIYSIADKTFSHLDALGPIPEVLFGVIIDFFGPFKDHLSNCIEILSNERSLMDAKADEVNLLKKGGSMVDDGPNNLKRMLSENTSIHLPTRAE